MNDVEHMSRALAQAATVRSTTAPNPWVGSVVIPPDSAADGGTVFAGATAPPGGPHAEVNALRGLTHTRRKHRRRRRAISRSSNAGSPRSHPSEMTTTTAPRATPRRP